MKITVKEKKVRAKKDLRKLYRRLEKFIKNNEDVDFFKLTGDDIDNDTIEELEISGLDLFYIKNSLASSINSL